MSPSRTPLVLISGFLGAGKTTFLRHLLPLLSKAGRRPRLIINDYGAAEIDAATLAQLSASVRAINGSCVCCESQDEFLNLLASEPLEPSTVMLVETNGTTDPYEIIESLGLDDRAGRFQSPLHVSIVDAQRWQKRWWHNSLERLQVQSASHLYLSKFDLVDSARLEKVKSELQFANSHASAISVSDLAGVILNAPSLHTRRSGQLDDEDEPDADRPYHHHQHELPTPHHHAHADASTHDFVSVQFPLPAQIEKAKMEGWLRALPRAVVRAKGFVRLSGSTDRLHSFQKVEDSVTVDFLPLDPAFAREPLVLLIGTGIDRASLPAL